LAYAEWTSNLQKDEFSALDDEAQFSRCPDQIDAKLSGLLFMLEEKGDMQLHL
jgi:hypothetical protein